MKECPQCGAFLIEVTVGEVRVDGCDGCGGVWFDHQELTLAARQQKVQLRDLEDRFQPQAGPPEPRRKKVCPNCQGELFEFEFKHSPGIRLDGCRQCQGIWVDEGELEAIHQRLTRPQPPPAPLPESPRTPGPEEKPRPEAAVLPRIPCPSCGEANPSDSLTCWACGIPLQGPSPLDSPDPEGGATRCGGPPPTPPQDEWVACPQCRYPMLRLQGFELKALGELPGFGPEVVWNEWERARQVRENQAAALRFWWRSRKVAKAQEHYRGSPRSLICPSCLYVLKR